MPPKSPSKKPAPKPVAKPAKTAARTPAKAAGKVAGKVAGKPSALPAKVASKPAAPKAAAPKAATAPPALSTECQQRSLANMKAFFDRTIAALDEADSAFTPIPGMFSTAQQVAHTAQTIDWFLEGAFSSSGFNMDFPGMEAAVRKVTSLAAAKKWLEEAYGRFERALKERPAAQWHESIVKDTIMGGAPRWSIVDGLVDHTAHHRGSLAVFARLRGKTPAMPYM